MTTKILATTLTLLAGLGTACGGSSNGKLSSRVSDAHLAPVSAAERAGESEAQREYFLAEWQLAYTKSQLKSAKLDIDIAKNDLASAKLDVKNAKLELKAAEETGDQNAIAKQQQAERIAHLRVEAQKVAVERAKQNKRYLEKRVVHEERAMRTREASVEMARANSLKAAGIKPPNFDAKRYKGQHAERVSSAKQSRGPVDTEHSKLKEIDKRFLAAKNAVLKAEGKPLESAATPETKPMGDLPVAPPVTKVPGDEPAPKPGAEVPEKPGGTETREQTPTTEPAPPPAAPPSNEKASKADGADTGETKNKETDSDPVGAPAEPKS